jgi:organic radical activating enzyme
MQRQNNSILQLKFCINSFEDVEWALEIVEQVNYDHLVFQPVTGKNMKKMCKLLLMSHLPPEARIIPQTHVFMGIR